MSTSVIEAEDDVLATIARTLGRWTLGGLLLLGACAPRAASPDASPTASKGARAADFALQSLEGRTVRLSDHLGKDVVMLNFWATWCAPCLGELPKLENLHQTYGPQGFTLLSIAMD